MSSDRWRPCLVGLLAALAVACGAPAAPTAGKPAAVTQGPPAVATAAAPTAAPAPTQLKAIYTALSGSTWPLWIAQDAGLLARNGINADLEYVVSSTTAMQALLSGEVAFIATASAPSVVQAALGGADAVIVGATNNTVIFTLMAAPGIREYADLRGKRLGVSRLGSSSDSAARSALGKWGLRPDDDVTIVQMGGIPEILAGMQAGAVEAGVLSTPTDLYAKRAGFHELADLGAIGIDYPQTAIATTRGYVRANEDVVRRYLRATVEAVHLLKTDPAQAQAIFGKYANTTDPEILQATYQAYADKTDAVPYARPAAMQVALSEVAQTDPRAAAAKVDDFVDNRYVQELEASGFIQQLYGR